MNQLDLHRRKILLVDDEPELLAMVEAILRDDGFEHVMTASTLAQAA